MFLRHMMFRGKEKWIVVSSYHRDATSWRYTGNYFWGLLHAYSQQGHKHLIACPAVARHLQSLALVITYGGISWGMLKWMNVLGTKITVLNMLQDLWLGESVTIRQEEGMSWKQCVPGGLTAMHILQDKNHQAAEKFGLILLSQILHFRCLNLWGYCLAASPKRSGLAVYAPTYFLALPS